MRVISFCFQYLSAVCPDSETAGSGTVIWADCFLCIDFHKIHTSFLPVYYSDFMITQVKNKNNLMIFACTFSAECGMIYMIFADGKDKDEREL